MWIGTALLLTGLMTVTPANAVPVSIVGPWMIETVPPASAESGSELPTVRLRIPRTEPVTVEGERHLTLRLFNPNTGGWMRGNRLKALIAQECTATGALDPASVVVRSTSDPTVVYTRGEDYEQDDLWATVGRLEGGRIAEDTAVTVDYTYVPEQIHSVVFGGDAPRLLSGTPGLAVVYPPEVTPPERAVLNIWVNRSTERLSEANLFPIDPALPNMPPVARNGAVQRLPKTLAKLRAGEPVRIVAWGDSVTVGGGVLPDMDKRYQDQFLVRLRERFPEAEIELSTAGWGGSNSAQWPKQPEGAEHHFQRDVLDPLPDLVTIEFVNDAYMTAEQTVAHYKMLLDRINRIGAEVIVLTPHLVRPDWMSMDTMKFDEDPRPYVQGLRQFADQYKVALADASAVWCTLWRRGIPYTTLLANAINHPDERGHRIFADALMALFPAQ